MAAKLSSVEVERAGSAAVVSMYGTPDGNAADQALHDALYSAFRDLSTISDVRAVVLTGTPTDFCRGRAVLAPPGQSAWQILADLTNNIVRLNRAIREAPFPVVATIEGRALSFGCGLAVVCDLSIAAADARFGFPELSHDLPPLIVTSYLGRMVGRKHAAHLVLTGREIDAAEACRIGLVGEVVEPRTARDAALNRALWLAMRDPLAVQLVRRFMREAESIDERASVDAGTSMMATMLSSRIAS